MRSVESRPQADGAVAIPAQNLLSTLAPARFILTLTILQLFGFGFALTGVVLARRSRNIG
jgi:hypothetical protein